MPNWRHVAGLFLLAALLLGATVTRPGSAITLATLTLTDRLLVADGTADAPSIAFSSAPNNGFFYSSILRWAESGTDRVSINSAGLGLTSGLCFKWTDSTTNSADIVDTQLCRGAANRIDLGANDDLQIPNIKSSSGVRYLCVNTAGLVVSQAAACSGT